jgi:hypothetical protein
MTTLTQPGLSSLIDRLFAEADAAEDARWPATAGDRADYRQYYGELKDQPLPVSRATGKLLRKILEGTFKSFEAFQGRFPLFSIA